MRGVCPSCAYQLLWFKFHPVFELGWIEVRIWIVKNGITQYVVVNPSVLRLCAPTEYTGVLWVDHLGSVGP